jgi:molecular chaperone GrpE
MTKPKAQSKKAPAGTAAAEAAQATPPVEAGGAEATPPAAAAVVESPPGGPGEASSPAAGALLEPPDQTIQRLSEELEALKDRHLRLAAEFDNFRKRSHRERLEAWSRAQAELALRLLDALDDLGRVAALDPSQASAKDILAGVEMVERKLLRELESSGLERVGAAGEVFDPNVHEAVSSVAAPDAEADHRVAAVLQPGYRFAGALLRPARVSVYVWQPPPAEPQPEPLQ